MIPLRFLVAALVLTITVAPNLQACTFCASALRTKHTLRLHHARAALARTLADCGDADREPVSGEERG